PAAMNAAMSPLSTERAGVGSALLMAVRQVGGVIGVSILGTLLSSGYRSRLNLTGLPAPVADAVRQSVNGGVAVANKLGSAPLRDGVQSAFVHGMDVTMWVCAGLAVVGVLLAISFLPARSETIRGTGTQEPTAP